VSCVFVYIEAYKYNPFSPYVTKERSGNARISTFSVLTKANCVYWQSQELGFKTNEIVSVSDIVINPLNAELNPICHLLVLLGDLTFMGPCIVSIFQHTSNKMQRYTGYLYLETALHVSGGTL